MPKKSKKKTTGFRIGRYTVVGFFLDCVVDVVLLLSMIPIIGIPFDILGAAVDFLSGLFWLKVLGSTWGLVSWIELVPMGLFDWLPTNIALGLYADSRGGEK